MCKSTSDISCIKKGNLAIMSLMCRPPEFIPCCISVYFLCGREQPRPCGLLSTLSDAVDFKPSSKKKRQRKVQRGFIIAPMLVATQTAKEA